MRFKRQRFEKKKMLGSLHARPFLLLAGGSSTSIIASIQPVNGEFSFLSFRAGRSIKSIWAHRGPCMTSTVQFMSHELYTWNSSLWCSLKKLRSLSRLAFWWPRQIDLVTVFKQLWKWLRQKRKALRTFYSACTVRLKDENMIDYKNIITATNPPPKSQKRLQT